MFKCKRWLGLVLCLVMAVSMMLPVSAVDPLSTSFASFLIHANTTDSPEVNLHIKLYRRGSSGLFLADDAVRYDCRVNRAAGDPVFYIQPKTDGVWVEVDYLTDLNGDGVISYVMFKGQEANAEAEARTQYGVEDANAVLVEAGKPELEYFMGADAATKYQVDPNGSWSSQAGFDFMSTNLSSYSEANGNMIELVICNNDGMAEGAVSALQSAGYNTGEEGSKSIPVFGVDATDSAKALIKAGQMTATVKQDAVGMAETITALVGNVSGGAGLMDGINADGGYNVDLNEDGSVKVNKIRVPYGIYDANSED